MPHPASGTAPADPSGRQDITDPATGGSRLLSSPCATCILRHGDPMHLGPERLRKIIGQALAAGSFVVCHDTLTYGDYPDYGPAICRGFFEAYCSRSPALVLLRAYRRLVEVLPPEAASPGTAAGIDRAAPGDDEVMSGGCDCAPCCLAGASDSGPAAGPCTTSGPGPQGQVHTCPCGEVLEYGAPGTGQEWHCGSGHSWSRAGGRFTDPSSGAHLLRPGDVR